ncbi:TagK domain-containing protein [Enterobacter ludwigii]|nr:TagK domain-containing protein [Enterobacter ludwigii]
MQLQLDWPLKGESQKLNAEFLSEGVLFCLAQGEFLKEYSEICSTGGMLLVWEEGKPTLIFESSEYQCLVDGYFLEPKQRHPLRLGMVIQAGPYRFSVIPVSEDIVEETSIPSLDELLTHGGYYTPWLVNDNELINKEKDEDVLKHLSGEYKRYLLWGEQLIHAERHENHESNKLPERDQFIENILENVKCKTVTECIFEDKTLINRVLGEILSSNQEFTYEDDRHDLLFAIAPENLQKIQRNEVSELQYRELYKLGLDSNL